MARDTTHKSTRSGSTDNGRGTSHGKQESAKTLSKRAEEAELGAFEKSGRFTLMGDNVCASKAGHKRYMAAIKDKHATIVFGEGPAGTGKTYLAMNMAIEALSRGDIERIIITRPAVEAEGESLGFLPGELSEKFSPYLAPLMEILKNRVRPGMVSHLLWKEKIMAVPLAFMRGRTFDNAWILADEAQNMNEGQMKMLLTRIGKDSKLIIDGDSNQSDIKQAHKFGYSGLADGIRRVGKLSITRTVRFSKDDCMRSDTVRAVLDCYEDEDEVIEVEQEQVA